MTDSVPVAGRPIADWQDQFRSKATAAVVGMNVDLLEMCSVGLDQFDVRKPDRNIVGQGDPETSLALSLFKTSRLVVSFSTDSGACPSRSRAAASSIADSRERSSGRAAVIVYCRGHALNPIGAPAAAALNGDATSLRVGLARSGPVSDIRARHQHQADGCRHPDTRRIADRQMRVQRAGQIECQAGERPFLEPREHRE